MYLGISSLVWVLGFLAVVAVLATAASVFALSAAYLRVGPGTSRRGQRWFALALLLATGLAAWGVPRMIPDGISDLSAAEREAALEARGLAWQLFWENPLERLSITRIVVAHIEPLAEPADPERFVPPRESCTPSPSLAYHTRDWSSAAAAEPGGSLRPCLPGYSCSAWPLPPLHCGCRPERVPGD